MKDKIQIKELSINTQKNLTGWLGNKKTNAKCKKCLETCKQPDTTTIFYCPNFKEAEKGADK